MKNMKKLAAFVLALTIVLGSFGTAFAVEVPEDVNKGLSAMLPEAVEALMDAGAVTGDTDGLFHPEANLTRAQVCCMLVKLINPSVAELSGTPTVAVPESGFTDLKGYGWAKDYINYAAQNDIALGRGNGKFAPGANVTLAELVTFTVRAAGITDTDLGGTWPENYVKKGAEMGLFAHMGLEGNESAMYESAEGIALMQKELATKEQAALMIYNAMDEIVANAEKDQPQGTGQDKAENAPVLEGLKFVDGDFDTDMTTFDGKPLAKNVKVYVYGEKKEYKDSMELPAKASEYLESNVLKYKNVSTKAWYKLENGKITQLIVPGDVGFSGRIYCVINDVGSRILNYEGKGVVGFDTLTAGREITWLGDDALASGELDEVTLGDNVAGKKDGVVFELYARNGEVKSVATAEDTGDLKGQLIELPVKTSGSGVTTGWATVVEADDDLIRTETGWYQVNENAAVYVINEDGDAYEVGSLSSIRDDDQVRFYDISDDDEDMADIIVVKKN